jgi:hypothetical protein
MPDFLSMVERSLKAVRYGIFSVNDQIALALDGFCHTPAMDYTDLTEASDPDFEPAYGSFCYGTVPLLDLSTPPVSAVSPQAADADSTPEAAVSRPSAKSALTTPAEGHLFHEHRSVPWLPGTLMLEACGSSSHARYFRLTAGYGGGASPIRAGAASRARSTEK